MSDEVPSDVAGFPAHQRGYAPSADVQLHYRRFGKPGRVPLIILHGLSFFSYDWKDLASRVAAEREVIAMDMRGFGDSSWSAEEKYGVADFAGDVIALMDNLKWERAVLFGHSLGGRNASFCGAKYSDRISALILGDYTPDASKAGTRKVMEVVAGAPEVFDTIDAAIRCFGGNGADPKVRVRYREYMQPTKGGFILKRDPFFRNGFRRILAGGQPPPGPDIWQSLRQIMCPILNIRGKRSPIFGEESVQRVREANKRLELVEVDAGHNIGADAFEPVLSEIGKFLVAHKL